MPSALPRRSTASRRSEGVPLLAHYRIKLEEVVEAHRIALLRGGGLDGMRDSNLIKAAIGRPYTGYYRSIHAKAAALTQSLCKNHGFVDGNKRTTLLILSLFLDRSGYQIVGPDKSWVGREVSDADSVLAANVEIDAVILSVVENQMSYEQLLAWFRARLRRRP